MLFQTANGVMMLCICYWNNRDHLTHKQNETNVLTLQQLNRFSSYKHWHNRLLELNIAVKIMKKILHWRGGRASMAYVITIFIWITLVILYIWNNITHTNRQHIIRYSQTRLALIHCVLLLLLLFWPAAHE